MGFFFFLSMGFFRQKCWSGVASFSLGDLPNPGIEHASLVSLLSWQGRFFTPEPSGKPNPTKTFWGTSSYHSHFTNKKTVSEKQQRRIGGWGSWEESDKSSRFVQDRRFSPDGWLPALKLVKFQAKWDGRPVLNSLNSRVCILLAVPRHFSVS